VPKKMRTNVSVGVSFTKEKLKEIDSQRGYISRSKWILLALETMTEGIENKVKNSAMQSPQVCRHVKTAADIIASTPRHEGGVNTLE
jgi:metal-responsive CopG/Arc/MetJ family transcriptional regulator